MARRLGVVFIRRATSSGLRFKVRGSTSTNSGRAPARTTELALAKKLNGVVMTESPGCTPAATKASHSASVPEAQPTVSCTPTVAETSFSNCATSAPRMNCCESHTRSSALRISARTCAYWRRKSSRGTCISLRSDLGGAVPIFHHFPRIFIFSARFPIPRPSVGKFYRS